MLSNSKHLRGFTLIELMVLVVVLAVVATIALPGFSNSIANNRDATQVSNLVDSLNLARSIAIKSGVPVTICAGSGAPVCSSTSTWSDGWVIYYSTLPPGTANPLIRVYPSSSSGSFTSDNGYSFTFQPNGALAPLPANPVNFTLCDARGAAHARSLDLLPTGRAEASTTIGYQVNGTTALSCS